MRPLNVVCTPVGIPADLERQHHAAVELHHAAVEPADSGVILSLEMQQLSPEPNESTDDIKEVRPQAALHARRVTQVGCVVPGCPVDGLLGRACCTASSASPQASPLPAPSRLPPPPTTTAPSPPCSMAWRRAGAVPLQVARSYTRRTAALPPSAGAREEEGREARTLGRRAHGIYRPLHLRSYEGRGLARQ